MDWLIRLQNLELDLKICGQLYIFDAIQITQFHYLDNHRFEGFQKI